MQSQNILEYTKNLINVFMLDKIMSCHMGSSSILTLHLLGERKLNLDLLGKRKKEIEI